ncbi:MAG: hypothetical protein FJW39_00080 [Acidobacteria bacterium]|nr:hypothetical protein [Acidobacteriota bacterium]
MILIAVLLALVNAGCFAGCLAASCQPPDEPPCHSSDTKAEVCSHSIAASQVEQPHYSPSAALIPAVAKVTLSHQAVVRPVWFPRAQPPPSIPAVLRI